jgi:hypothetical protein
MLTPGVTVLKGAIKMRARVAADTGTGSSKGAARMAARLTRYRKFNCRGTLLLGVKKESGV